MQPLDHSRNAIEASQERWLVSSDGSKQFLRSWSANTAQGQVLYLHGIEGHGLWIADTAHFLQKNGISVHALDRRGAGRSNEAKGDLSNYKLLLSDVQMVLEELKRSSDAPLFLMANCWGAKVAAVLCRDDHACSKILSGLILSSPAIAVKVDLTFKQKVAIAWRLLTGNHDTFDIPLVPEDFTDNPVYLDFIRQDKLRLLSGTAQFFFNGQILGLIAKSSAKKITMPTLIVQAGTDSIVEQSGIEKWFEELGSKDKKLEVFAGVYHSLDFDQNPDPYRRRILEWITQMLNQSNRGAMNRENSLA